MHTATHVRRRGHRWIAATALAALTALLGACGGGDEPTAGAIVSRSSFAAPAALGANSTLLVHWMTGASGRMVKATSVLHVPKGTAPAAGWPLVVWVHATTTSGSGPTVATGCAPSLSPDLDGSLTADGFPTGYVDLIAALVAAGYAVVAPDYEGLGAQAAADGTPYPYYQLDSSGRSVAAAVLAAHRAGVPLANGWMAMGHSEGGHAVMALETSATEASAYAYKGSIAIAPYNSIEASVDLLGTLAAGDAANRTAYATVQELFVGMMASGLGSQGTGFTPDQVMGADLLAAMPSIRGKCIFKSLNDVGAAIAAKTPAAFQGHTAQWAQNAAMKAFLQTNDLAVRSGYTFAKPMLVVQGSADPFVFESLQTAFIGRLRAANLPVTYKTYAGADHGSIVTLARADMLAFLKATLP